MTTIEQRKKRWLEFYDLNSDVNYLYEIYVPYVRKGVAERSKPAFWPELWRERIDWILYEYENKLECCRLLEDDRLPYLTMLTGTDIFAEAFGCWVHRPPDNRPFALPFVHTAAEAARVKVPRLEDSTLSYLFEMADILREKAGKDALFKPVDLQSPMDIAALIWDKNDLFPAMVEEPEAVKELCCKTHELLTSFLDEWFRRYGKTFIAHHPDYYMPYGVTLSEDEAGSVSPEMFEEFFLPHLTALSERYGQIGIHCCANAMHQWENFKKIPNLRLLNLAQPDDVIEKAYRVFEGHTCVFMMGGKRSLPEDFSSRTHVVSLFEVDSFDKAVELGKRLSELSRREEWFAKHN